MRSRTVSSVPDDSPASTIATNSRLKTFGMARERAREDHARLDVGANVDDHLAQVLVVGLLLERDERGDDADAGLDHRRQLAREDLQRLRLDLLERAAAALLAGGRLLAQLLRQKPARLQLLARVAEVGRAG